MAMVGALLAPFSLSLSSASKKSLFQKRQTPLNFTTMPNPPPPPKPPPFCGNDDKDGSGFRRPEENAYAYYLRSFQSDEEVMNEIRGAILPTLLPPDETVAIVYISSVQPVLQNGPVCGLVAIGMAAEVYESKNVSLDGIFEIAKANNMTKSGEMFSAEEMKELAKLALNCNAEVINTEESGTPSRTIETLLNGDVALVPYDADHNHSPCQRNGHAAHWALVIGFAISFPKTQHLDDLGEMSLVGSENIDFKNPRSILAHEKVAIGKLMNSPSQIVKIHLICRQGKSKHVGVWSYENLIQSNQNLREVNLKIKERPENFIIQSIGHTLRSQIILLRRNAS